MSTPFFSSEKTTVASPAFTVSLPAAQDDTVILFGVVQAGPWSSKRNMPTMVLTLASRVRQPAAPGTSSAALPSAVVPPSSTVPSARLTVMEVSVTATVKPPSS